MRCFLFPHTRFIRCYESLPAYAWKGFLLFGKISGSRNNSEFSHCSSYGKEKSKFFYSEGLKTRGCFCIWWRISNPAEKTEYFFRQHGCILTPRCPKKMRGVCKQFENLRKSSVEKVVFLTPFVQRRWRVFTLWWSLTTEWPSERNMTLPWRRKAERSDAAERTSGAGIQTKQSGKAANPVFQ